MGFLASIPFLASDGENVAEGRVKSLRENGERVVGPCSLEQERVPAGRVRIRAGNNKSPGGGGRKTLRTDGENVREGPMSCAVGNRRKGVWQSRKPARAERAGTSESTWLKAGCGFRRRDGRAPG
jgi:hypothetical protein